jgi:hypothetical protein
MGEARRQEKTRERTGEERGAEGRGNERVQTRARSLQWISSSVRAEHREAGERMSAKAGEHGGEERMQGTGETRVESGGESGRKTRDQSRGTRVEERERTGGERGGEDGEKELERSKEKRPERRVKREEGERKGGRWGEGGREWPTIGDAANHAQKWHKIAREAPHPLLLSIDLSVAKGRLRGGGVRAG